MTEKQNDEPCLVQTEQGFSVIYKEKFLYSKYSPQKQISKRISELDILTGTVILCFSPVLGYGLNELISACPENCAVLLCEKDSSLRKFAQSQEYTKTFGENRKKFSFLEEDEFLNLPVILQKKSFTFKDGYSLLPAGSYRRILRIDFSAGVNENPDFYNALEQACVKSIQQFWANRVTLTKFGRRYSMNLFKNLHSLQHTEPIENFVRSVEKPIVVFGAGESAEKICEEILPVRESFFILCADTAFPMLNSRKISPDGIVLEEAQTVIAQSFIGAGKSGAHIFQSLSSLPHPAGINFPSEKISFFATEYADTNFFDDLKSKDFFPLVIPPFGSVGLTATKLALLFRKNTNIPVFVCGLDFSFKAGKTHARGALATKSRLIAHNKIIPLENCGSSFNEFAEKVPSKDGKTFFTTYILNSYAQSFKMWFSREENLFDAGNCGVNLGIPQKDISNASNELSFKSVKSQNPHRKESASSVKKYLDTERANLEMLRDILSGKTKFADENEQNEKICNLVQNREYLFLHFADGIKFSKELSFLKRIRAEIDFFLKYI